MCPACCCLFFYLFLPLPTNLRLPHTPLPHCSTLHSTFPWAASEFTAEIGQSWIFFLNQIVWLLPLVSFRTMGVKQYRINLILISFNDKEPNMFKEVSDVLLSVPRWFSGNTECFLISGGIILHSWGKTRYHFHCLSCRCSGLSKPLCIILSASFAMTHGPLCSLLGWSVGVYSDVWFVATRNQV